MEGGRIEVLRVIDECDVEEDARGGSPGRLPQPLPVARLGRHDSTSCKQFNINLSMEPYLPPLRPVPVKRPVSATQTVVNRNVTTISWPVFFAKPLDRNNIRGLGYIAI